MTDWIDDLKRKTKEEQDYRLRQEEIVLHKSKTIKARLPKFWKVLVEQIQTDCLKLKETFPNEDRYHCEMEAVGNSLKVISKNLPRRILEVELNVEGQCIDVSESRQSDTLSEPISGKTGQIKIDLNNDLIFSYHEKDCKTPEELSRLLFSKVLWI